MPAANQDDFFGEGTAAAAFAPQETPAQRAERQRLKDEAERKRREQDRLESANLASAGRQNLLDSGQKTVTTAPGKWGIGSTHATRNETANYDSNVWDDVKKIWTTDPVTTGILAAPYGVAAAGAFIPAAGASAAALGTTAAPTYGAVGMMPASSFAGSGAGTLSSVAAPTVIGAPTAAGLISGGTTAAAAAPWLTPGNVLGGLSLATQVGGMVYNQIRTKAEKDLIKKQEEIAAAADARRAQVQQEGMNRLGQQMLAMNPMNQAMAEMFGPSAAYTPQQMAGMVADPGAVSWEEARRLGSATDPESQAKVERTLADWKRQQMVQSNTTPLGPGPAPLQQRTPQAARRF